MTVSVTHRSTRLRRGFARLSVMLATAAFFGGLLATAVIPFTPVSGGPAAVDRGRMGIAVLTDELRFINTWPTRFLPHTRIDERVAEITHDCAGPAGGLVLTQTMVVLPPAAHFQLGCLENTDQDSEVLILKRVSPLSTSTASLDPQRNYLLLDNRVPLLISGASPPAARSIFSMGAYEYSSTIYFVEHSMFGPGRLMQKRLIGSKWSDAQPIIDGVESMHILAGIDTDNDGLADTFDEYGTPASLQRTVAIKIVLTLHQSGTGPIARLAEFFVPDARAGHRITFEVIVPLVVPRLILAEYTHHPARETPNG